MQAATAQAKTKRKNDVRINCNRTTYACYYFISHRKIYIDLNVSIKKKRKYHGKTSSEMASGKLCILYFAHSIITDFPIICHFSTNCTNFFLFSIPCFIVDGKLYCSFFFMESRLFWSFKSNSTFTTSKKKNCFFIWKIACHFILFVY